MKDYNLGNDYAFQFECKNMQVEQDVANPVAETSAEEVGDSKVSEGEAEEKEVKKEAKKKKK